LEAIPNGLDLAPPHLPVNETGFIQKIVELLDRLKFFCRLEQLLVNALVNEKRQASRNRRSSRKNRRKSGRKKRKKKNLEVGRVV